MSNIYIEVNNETVTKVHYMPFHEKHGMGKTEQELLQTGLLVESIPTPDTSDETKNPILMFDGESFYYEYEDIIEQVSSEERIEQLENENAELWYDIMLKESRISEHDNDIADIWYEIMLGGAV